MRKTNDPAMSLLKRYIVNLGYCEPYWDGPAFTNPEMRYEYPTLAEEPNCFTEAIERADRLLSLQHRLFSADSFLCRRNEEKIEIGNITEVKKLLKELLWEDQRRVRYIIERYPYQRSVTCAVIDGKCFAEEALLENGLEKGDLLYIVERISQLIEDLRQGRKTDLWDKLQEDIFELRLHVSAGRTFRLLFVQSRGIQFLNGFIKKTQKTPDAELDKAVKIKKQLH